MDADKGAIARAPSDRDLERALVSVPGVAEASVTRTSSGGRRQLRIRLTSGEEPGEVAWAIAATLRERFDIVIDPEVIRPRIEATAADAEPSPTADREPGPPGSNAPATEPQPAASTDPTHPVDPPAETGGAAATPRAAFDGPSGWPTSSDGGSASGWRDRQLRATTLTVEPTAPTTVTDLEPAWDATAGAHTPHPEAPAPPDPESADPDAADAAEPEGVDTGDVDAVDLEGVDADAADEVEPEGVDTGDVDAVDGADTDDLDAVDGADTEGLDADDAEGPEAVEEESSVTDDAESTDGVEPEAVETDSGTEVAETLGPDAAVAELDDGQRADEPDRANGSRPNLAADPADAGAAERDSVSDAALQVLRGLARRPHEATTSPGDEREERDVPHDPTDRPVDPRDGGEPNPWDTRIDPPTPRRRERRADRSRRSQPPTPPDEPQRRDRATTPTDADGDRTPAGAPSDLEGARPSADAPAPRPTAEELRRTASRPERSGSESNRNGTDHGPDGPSDQRTSRVGKPWPVPTDGSQRWVRRPTPPPRTEPTPSPESRDRPSERSTTGPAAGAEDHEARTSEPFVRPTPASRSATPERRPLPEEPARSAATGRTEPVGRTESGERTDPVSSQGRIRAQSVRTVAPSALGERGPRAAIRHLDTSRHERAVRVIATLEQSGRTARGEASTVPTTNGMFRAVAEATIAALTELVGPALVAGIDRVQVQPADEPANVMVAVSLVTHRGEETLLGASVVRGDVDHAVMRATLDALNRRLGGLQDGPVPAQKVGSTGDPAA